jgi:hypothetical protein
MNENLVIFSTFAGFTVIAFGAMWFFRKRTLDAMRRVASELGYSFSGGGGEGSESRMASLPPALARAVAFMAPWKIEGREGDSRVNIFTITRGSGKSRTTYTVVEMSVHPRERINFTLSKEGFFSKVGKALLGTQDIQIGDESFDTRVMVKGSDPAKVQALLATPTFRASILEAIEAYPSLTVSGELLRFERSGIITKPEFYRELIGKMKEIATGLAG